MEHTVKSITDWKVIEAGQQVHAQCTECAVTVFLATMLCSVIEKIYETAPNEEEAEKLISKTIEIAKKQ